MRIHWGPNRAFPMLLLGHSIFRRTCRTNVGELAARYGGGGHQGAGSLPLMEEPDQQIRMIVAELMAKGCGRHTPCGPPRAAWGSAP